MKKFSFIICFLHFAAALAAQVKSFSVETDKNSIVIGEQFQLSVKTVLASTQPVAVFSIDSLAHFEILSKAKPDSQEQGNEIAITQTYILTSWDSGSWQIPSFRLARQSSKPVTITVSFAPFNPAGDYHDIKEIIEVEKQPRSTWYWYLLGLLLVVVLAILLFPAGKKQQPAEKPQPRYRYNTRDAMLALEKLENEYAGLSSKIFYTELVDVFRSYLKLKLQTDPFTTATELLADKIDEMELPAAIKKEVKDVLWKADLAKFARHEAADEERLASIQAVKKLIQSTDKKP